MAVLLITVSIIVVVPLTLKLPIIFILFKVDCPETFKDDNNVDEPETNRLLKFVLLKIAVDVAFKLFIDNVEFVDNEFKLLNVVVDVAFKLFIDNVELVEYEFKLLNIVVDVAFKLLINNLELVE